jgi:hypothetical protein
MLFSALSTVPFSPVPQGRKIVIFDLSIVARWEGELLDGEGRRAGTGDGDIVIEDLDQDTELAQMKVTVKASDDGGANDKQLARILGKWGLPVIKKKVWQFVEELRAKE